MGRRMILVVDDEKNIRLTVAQTLAGEELAVETAVNGEDALEKLRQQPFDLVLLDMRLPGIDGLETLRRIHGEHPRLPIVMLSAHGTVESAVAAMREGACDFVQKPFAPSEIREAVRRALMSPPYDRRAPDVSPLAEPAP